MGVPGLAKTLLVNSIAQTTSLSFGRIQFTPDLMPSDILGSEILEENAKSGKDFRFIEGPIFSQLLLADEINRASPRTQSALLQAMQEKKVTITGETYDLPKPFHVLATQNPIDQEGTYPLPEAQLDRFMFKLIVDYPSIDSEKILMRLNTTSKKEIDINPIVQPETIIDAQKLITEIYVDEKVEDYILNLVFATRDPLKFDLKDLDGIIDVGASPRATINILKASKSRAFTESRGYVTPEDVRYVSTEILRHRVILTYEAEAEELTTDQVITRIFEKIEVP